MEREIWKAVVGFSRYMVSSHGRVRSTIRKGRLLKPWSMPNGYVAVSLMSDDGKRVHKRTVHSVVAEAFCPKPSDAECVNHLNGCKADNRAANLEWTTYKANLHHALDNGLNRAHGETHYKAKLSCADVIEIRKMVALGALHREAAVRFSVDRRTVTKIVNGQTWGRA